MLSEEDFYSRLALEAKMMEEEEPSFKPVQGDLKTWRGFILGTRIYEGGVFEIEITITRKFPYMPPKVRWITPIWHPNIRGEKVCIGILGKDWSPTMSLVGTIEALRNLLNFPNPNDPLNRQAAMLMKKDLNKFEQMVKEHMKGEATWNNIKE